MLEGANFWFSRLTLVHALCLWALPESAEAERPTRGREPRALVRHWLSSRAKTPEHPFVSEARDLAILALEQVQPERFIWLDETGVVTRIGARPPRWDAVRKHNLWIPPSAGWGALHPRAQRLVADVLLLLNLIERGADPTGRERRLKRAMREDLPPCLKGEREYLDPARTIGMATRLAPGANCKDECPFDLCPYPEKGGRAAYRVELSEAFCRRQRVLLGHWWQLFTRSTAPWQGATPGDLRRFWSAMEERARW